MVPEQWAGVVGIVVVMVIVCCVVAAVSRESMNQRNLLKRREEHAHASWVVGAPHPWPFSVMSHCRCRALTRVESRHGALR